MRVTRAGVASRLGRGRFSAKSFGFLPKLIRVDVTQMTSESSGATERSPVSRSPYLWWKGSIMVTYFLSLIGWAKNSPPARGQNGS